MPKNPHTRSICITLGLALAIGACASFTSVTRHHEETEDFITEASVAVLVNPSGSDLVVFFEGLNEVHVHNPDGTHTGHDFELQGFDVVSVAPGADLQLWALDALDVVHLLEFNPSGTMAAPDHSFAVEAGAEDIAVSLDGESIYVTTSTHVHRYAQDGDELECVPLQRESAWSIYGAAQRVAVDTDTGHVYSLEPLYMNWGGAVKPVFRYTRMNPDLSNPQYTNAPINDGEFTLYDFEVAAGNPIWERGFAFGATKLEYVDGLTAQDTISVNLASSVRAGTLSSAGVQSSLAACGGDQGGILWRARNSDDVNMLERHLLCEN